MKVRVLAFAALIPCLAMLPVQPASAESYRCAILEESAEVRAYMSQTYWSPGRPITQPEQEVSASLDGIFFSSSSYPHWRSLEAPFELPRRIILGVNMPERPASRGLTLYAPGARPIALRGYIYGAQESQSGAGFESNDRAVIQALLTIRSWTGVVRHPDGRVQQIVPVRMPMTLDRLRALRESQVARMREMARDPYRLCAVVEDESAIISN